MTKHLETGNLQTPLERCSSKLAWRRPLNIGLISCTSAMFLLNPCGTFADEASSTGSTSTSSANSGSTSSAGANTSSSQNNPASSGKPIQAGVQMIELNLQVLRDVGLDIKNILKAASSLYDEVTIQPVTIQTMPEVVGRGTIINIPVGFTPSGNAPQPSKKRVDLSMNQMRPIIQMMKQDVDDFESGRRRLDISDAERQELEPLFDQWVKLVNDINSNLVTLESLAKSPPYNNAAIAKAAGAIHRGGKKMDEVRRKLYKSLQKEGKKQKYA